MTRSMDSSDTFGFGASASCSRAARRRSLQTQASRLSLRSTVAAATLAGISMIAPGQAWAQCIVGGVTVTCGDTPTTNTTYPANPPADREYQGVSGSPIVVNVNPGATVSGNGIAVSNSGTGGVTVANSGTISVDAGNTPTAGGTAALAIKAAGGPIIYTGDRITNNGDGDALDVTQTAGVGSIDITANSDIFAANGQGITVRDVTTSTGVNVTTYGTVTALTAGKDGIDVQAQSLTGNVTVVANGDVAAGNAGLVGAILQGAATGNVDVTANGKIDARFGIDAENFGSGNTTVTTAGPVTVTTGNGIFALATGGNVKVTAGDVTATGNTAIIARQTKAAGLGTIDVTAGNVSGTTGIEATNAGNGATSVTTTGLVTGTFAEGIKATGGGAVSVSVADTVTGATTGLLLTGGTGGTGDINVTGAGGFFGGTGNAATIQNNGSGKVTVDISGDSGSTGGEGITVRDTAAGGDISVTTGKVTALAVGKDGIDVQTVSTTGNVTIVANGDIAAGNAGIVGAIVTAGTGNVDVTANGKIDARFGVDAENFGTGNTTVTTVGPVTVTNGVGIFASTNGGNVKVSAGDVSSTDNTGIIGRQGNAGGAGTIDLTGGNVSGTTGIEATNSGTGATSVTTTGLVTGTLAEGIKATGNDAVTVNVADTVTGATRGLTLVGGTGGAGDISVTGTGGFVGQNGDGADILNNGSGTTTVNISGATTATGGNGISVSDTTAGGNISVTTGAVTGSVDAINVLGQTATGNLTVVANGDLKAGNAGLVGAIVNSAATGNVDVTANGKIDARFGVDAENFGSGATTVTTVGPVNVTNGNGIFALTTGGNLKVTTGAVTAISNTAIIAQQVKAGAAGTIDVRTNGAVSGTTGIGAINNGTGAISITANDTVAGTAAAGINVAGNDAVSVKVANTVTGATSGLLLLAGNGGAGDSSVTGAGGFAGGTGDGANITNLGSGKTTVNISGATSSTSGNGIVINDTAVGGDISVTTGAVTALAAGQNGINTVSTSTAGNLTVVANGDVQAGNAGIVAALIAPAATGNVDVTANAGVTGVYGVDAENQGSGSVTVKTVGPVAATTGNGIFGLTNGGNLKVSAGDVSSTGNIAIIAQQINAGAAGTIDTTANGTVVGTNGIVAVNSGTGSVKVSGAGNVTGTAGVAILATSTSGNVDVLSTGAINGATGGIAATSLGGTVTVSGTGAVTAANGIGISASSDTGNVFIAPASTVTATGGAGIRGQVGGNGSTTITTAGKVTSTTGMGIVAIANNGLARVTANGQVSGVTAGIAGVATGSGSVGITANANVSASNGPGVMATLQGAGAGTITVSQAAGTLISATAGHGIQTNSGTSTGLTVINVAGEVKATGANNAGVRGTSTAGGITVNVATTGKIDPDFGVALDTVSGALAVNNSGLIAGDIAGVQLVATGSGTASINNAGTITGPNAVVGSLNGGSFTLLNQGILNGGVGVAGSNVATSLWTNAAGSTANLGSGASSFTGSLVNTGTTNIGAGGTLGIFGNSSNIGRVNFAGAGSFTTLGSMSNTGIINAQNNLTTNVVTVGGSYTGGGQFFADFSTATATADRLNIVGSASGNTNVTMNRVGGVNFVTGGFLPVVVVNGGAASTAFTSNTVFPTTGFVLESFAQNPANNTQFGLLQTVNPLAGQLGNLSFMAESASALLDDPISPYVTRRTDSPAGSPRFSLWMRLGTGHTRQRIDSVLTGGGVTYVGSTSTRIDHQAAQIGADLAFSLGGGGWNANVGVMGGWYDGQAPLNATDRIKVETPFVGGYVVVGNGAFTAEGTIRKEWRHYKLAIPTLFGTNGTQKLDGDAMAYSVRASYRVGRETGFAATPFVSYNYADSKIDPLQIDAFSVWTPGSDKTSIGQGGLRVSYRTGSDTGWRFEPFAGAARLENWSNRDGSSFAYGSPVTVFSLNSTTWKDAMRYSLGVMGDAASGRVSAFLVGDITDGSRIKSYTIHAGLRFNF